MEENIDEIKDSYLAMLYSHPENKQLSTRVLSTIDVSTAKSVAFELSKENLITFVANIVCITEKGIDFCESKSFSNPNKSILQMVKEIKVSNENPDTI